MVECFFVFFFCFFKNSSFFITGCLSLLWWCTEPWHIILFCFVFNWLKSGFFLHFIPDLECKEESWLNPAIYFILCFPLFFKTPNQITRKLLTSPNVLFPLYEKNKKKAEKLNIHHLVCKWLFYKHVQYPLLKKQVVIIYSVTLEETNIDTVLRGWVHKSKEGKPIQSCFLSSQVLLFSKLSSYEMLCTMYLCSTKLQRGN